MLFLFLKHWNCWTFCRRLCGDHKPAYSTLTDVYSARNKFGRKSTGGVNNMQILCHFLFMNEHRARRWKTRRSRVLLTKVRGVWKCIQTQVRVFDTASQTNTYFSGESEGEMWLIYASVGSTRHACDFPLFVLHANKFGRKSTGSVPQYVFDTTSQTNTCFRRKRRRNLANLCKCWINPSRL